MHNNIKLTNSSVFQYILLTLTFFNNFRFLQDEYNRFYKRRYTTLTYQNLRRQLESIAFYNEEIAIRMLKQVTTIVISHGHFYYCHFSCVHGETQGHTKNHYKNKCQRHVGFDNLSEAGYFDHRGRYSRIQYVLGQDSQNCHFVATPQLFSYFKSLIPERYTTYLMRLFSVFNYPEIQLFNHSKRENLLRLLDNVNSEITENNTDSSEEESCSSSESSTSEHETESAEVNQDRRKNSIKQLIAILDDPRLKNEDIESAMIYLNKILGCKDFLNPNPNRNSAIYSVSSEKRIQPKISKTSDT
ncbi:Hypothetical_protein [Hexamita inflata]|uniref:Hypothetical_protein n=1 Tax=Hexamita inflata TaxID=28002 RepID=A0AA86N6E3_9EUKA|nr:Hypothetical protein HINF_LOCUS1251 [Hexamita inflata]